MIGTLMDICWWCTKKTCSSLWSLALPAPPNPEEELRRQIWVLKTKVLDLEAQLIAERAKNTFDADDFDVLPVQMI